MINEKTYTEWLPYTFSEQEKRDIASKLAQANQALSELNDRKAQVAADFKAQITATESVIAKESRRYTNGYEFRDVDCDVLFDKPSHGLKTIVRKDTGEVVKEREMTSEDMQQKLDLSGDQ